MPDIDKISAGKLRSMGASVPQNIPDCATIPRKDVTFGQVKINETTDDTVSVEIPVVTKGTFKWVDVGLVVTPFGIKE